MLVEEVKTQYFKENALFKNSLEVSYEQEIYYNTKKNDLVLQFYERSKDLFDLLNMPPFVHLSTEVNDCSNWNNFRKLINKKINEIIADSYRLLLYFDDSDKLKLSADSLSNALIKYVIYAEEIFEGLSNSKSNEIKSKGCEKLNSIGNYLKSSTEIIKDVDLYYSNKDKYYEECDAALITYAENIRGYFIKYREEKLTK